MTVIRFEKKKSYNQTQQIRFIRFTAFIKQIFHYVHVPYMPQNPKSCSAVFVDALSAQKILFLNKN